AALNGNKIPETVYDNLIDAVHEKLPVFHRYIDLRKKVLDVEELHMYDLYTPLVQDGKMTVDYEQAKKYVLESLAPLGEEYQGIVQKAFNHRWIDVVENKGKRSGAYPSGTYGTNPFILMNWQNNINNLYTLIQDGKMTVDYEQAKKYVLESLAPLGEEYQGIVQKAFNHRWIDVVENKGKRSGAYPSGTYGTNPFILMNWQNNINNLYTLTHELGHSVHSYYTTTHQPFRYGNYSIFVAEVASTCNEALLSEYLLHHLDD